MPGIFRHRFIPPPARNRILLFAYTSDVTAPVLSTCFMYSTGATTAAGSVTTDENNGTIYWVTTTSITQPSIAQIKAGQDHLGAAAVDNGTIAVSAIGAQPILNSGLTESVTYYLHAVHTDVALNDSNRITSNAFIPSSITVVPGSLSLLGAGI